MSKYSSPLREGFKLRVLLCIRPSLTNLPADLNNKKFRTGVNALNVNRGKSRASFNHLSK
jgi:hypothetical protein